MLSVNVVNIALPNISPHVSSTKASALVLGVGMRETIFRSTMGLAYDGIQGAA